MDLWLLKKRENEERRTADVIRYFFSGLIIICCLVPFLYRQDTSEFDQAKLQQIAGVQNWYQAENIEQGIDLLKQNYDQQVLYRNALLAAMLLILVTSLLVYNHLRRKIKNIEKDLEKIRFKKKQLEHNLESKNQQLLTQTLHLVQKNKIMKELKDKVNGIQDCNGNGKINRGLQKLDNLVDFSFNLDEDWEQFRIYFEETHNGFFEILREKYPDLTPGEMRLAALIKLNLTIKETATILGITPNSVKTARYRLRKKLGMETEENLTEFMIDVEKEIT